MENKSMLVDGAMMGVGVVIFFSSLLTASILGMQVGGSLTGIIYMKLFIKGGLGAARRRRQTK